MKPYRIIPFLVLIFTVSCINLEEEPILLVNPTAELSAHIKNEKIYATVLVNVNPQVLTAGNIPILFDFSGELEIFNTMTGNPIDGSTFSGDGLSQVYTVSADTASHERFVVSARGRIQAFADIGNDGDPSNDKLIASGDFYSEAQYIISEMVPATEGSGIR
ncbi:MAG: hypothetical protein ACWGNV_01985 [Bacteroidales bacterium]